jgi:PD-(D/E)XK nuclease superfamily
VQQRLSSFDLPEHRQMGACLRSWAAWLGAAAESLERALPNADGERQRLAASWIARCNRLARRVSAIAAASPFAEAAEAPARLTLSALFRNDPNYRRFYRLWQDMNLGIAAIFGDFLNLPLARTFELYELWCFLRLVRAAVDTFGPAGVSIGDLFITEAAGGVTLATGAVTVTVGSGWKLCFQRQYREFWTAPDREGSFSRIMTPDIVAARPPASAGERGRVIVLDAKYRIGDGLNDALSSIHTYRDALVREVHSGDTEGIVTAAYLLTPYVPELKTCYRDTPMPGRLFHPDYRTGFRFGAVTFAPGMTLAEIASALIGIIADAAAS